MFVGVVDVYASCDEDLAVLRTAVSSLCDQSVFLIEVLGVDVDTRNSEDDPAELKVFFVSCIDQSSVICWSVANVDVDASCDKDLAQFNFTILNC
jgi:hypothetical protein